MSKVGDVLKGIRSIVKIAATKGGDPDMIRLITELPSDVRTVLKAMPFLSPPSRHTHAARSVIAFTPGIRRLVPRSQRDARIAPLLMRECVIAPLEEGRRRRLVLMENIWGNKPKKTQGRMGRRKFCPSANFCTKISSIGVVPGPSSPSEEEINHILSPLVDDLLVLWNEGIFLSRTPLHPQGVRVRCAMVPVVCDLPAAHQIAGAKLHTSNQPCLQCNISSSDMHNLDYQNWPIYDGGTLKTLGRQWRDAATKELQVELFGKHGVRWSEFFRLSYWDPAQHVVVDSMHASYLGLFQRHCREVWGLDISAKDGLASFLIPSPSLLPRREWP
ncbi:Zn(2)-C6 fungal-type domain-containing protein [Salix suchowensis]|nr:Zn(2)-C6 fungal-type domain-containing protein [Salix suchowensis]